MKGKSVTLTKGKSKFLQNQRGKGDFSVENLGLFIQSSGNLKKNYHKKLKAYVASQIAEQFRTYDLRK